jgi:PAS domain S-box-containing protein
MSSRDPRRPPFAATPAVGRDAVVPAGGAALDEALRAVARLAGRDGRETLLQEAAALVRQYLPARRVVIALRPRGDGPAEPVLAVEEGQPLPPWTVRHLVQPAAQAALEAGTPIVRGPDRTVPLIGPTQRLGVLHLTLADQVAPPAWAAVWLELLGATLAAGLESWRRGVRLAAERRLTDAAAELARVALEASDAAQQAADAPASLTARHAHRLLEVLARVAPASGLLLSVVDTGRTHFEALAATGVLEGLDGVRYPRSDSPDSLAVQAGQSRRIDDLRAAVHADIAARVPAGPALATPLVVGGRQFGVLVATRPAEPAGEPGEWALLERLSSAVAVALDVVVRAGEARLRRERERLLATALATLELPVFVVEGDRIRYANRAAEGTYGFRALDWVGASYDALVVARQGAAGADDTPPAVDGEGALPSVEERHRRRDGSEFPAVVVERPLVGPDRRTMGRVICVRDVSDERRLADHLREAEKMVALGELVGGVAHEINNPLTGISALAQLLLADPLPPEIDESVRLIKREVDRAKAVVHDLQLFARGGEGVHTELSMNDLVEETLRLRAYRLRQAEVEVVLLLDPSAPAMRGDPSRLKQMLLHLVVNAEDAMREASARQLTVRTRAVGDALVVSVRDSGVGMPEEVRRRALEPFFSTKPAGAGSGLGLSVAFGIAQAHGGRLVIESAPGQGTQVAVHFPVAAAPLGGRVA